MGSTARDVPAPRPAGAPGSAHAASRARGTWDRRAGTWARVGWSGGWKEGGGCSSRDQSVGAGRNGRGTWVEASLEQGKYIQKKYNKSSRRGFTEVDRNKLTVPQTTQFPLTDH